MSDSVFDQLTDIYDAMIDWPSGWQPRSRSIAVGSSKSVRSACSMPPVAPAAMRPCSIVGDSMSKEPISARL